MLSLRHILLLFASISPSVCDSTDGAVTLSPRRIEPNPKRGHWVDTWATMPQLTEPANLPPAPFNHTGVVFQNSTIRQTLKVSVAANQIRLKISNAFGTTPLPITAVSVALPANDTAGIHQIQPNTLQTVTFSGRDSISIPNGAIAVSDPLDFHVRARSVVTVSIYLKDGQTSNFITSHPGSRTTSWFGFGNEVNSASISVSDPKSQSAAHWYFLSSIEAWVPPAYGSLTIVGDSITDGRGSETDKNNRWPDLLHERLQKSHPTRHIAISNQAAGGNRILNDGLGPNALGRIDRDVLAHPGVKYALTFEGVNDIGTAEPTQSAQEAVYESLVQAYQQMVTRIHALGIPVFGATITPFSAPSNFTGQPYSHPEREKTRVRINKWIRESGVFDEVVDFDAMIRDPQIPSQLKKEYDSGDYLHPGVPGFQRMADKFPVRIFEKWQEGYFGFD